MPRIVAAVTVVAALASWQWPEAIGYVAVATIALWIVAGAQGRKRR